MQNKEETPLRPEDPIRILKTGPLLFHHRHVSAGATRASGCRVCTKGFEAVVVEVAEPANLERRSVVPDDRADKERTGPLPPDSWWDYGQGPVSRPDEG